MNYCYIDFETPYSKENTLKRKTLRQYLAAAGKVDTLTVILNDGVPMSFSTEQIDDGLLADLKAIAESDEWCVVAHNAAFDIRVWRFLLGLPQPRHVLCTLELCCAAFPNQAGGYSLANLAVTLNTGLRKLTIDFTKATADELRIYCEQDTLICRRLCQLALPRLSADEIKVALLTNQVRELWLDIDSEAVLKAIAAFTTAADEAAQAVLDIFDDAEATEAFGYQDGDGTKTQWDEEGREVHTRSVRTHSLKHLLLDHLGFDTQSISLKKINPEKLRAAPEAAAVIHGASRANKALSFSRKVKVFSNLEAIDVELGYARATATMRFSSPAPGGRGLNLHNLSKRDKRTAKVLRSMFRWPENLVCVRADLMNVEYRIQCLLCGCAYAQEVFTANAMADPYLAFGNRATGRVWTKVDAIRQLFKAAVLGLGYLMSLHRFAEELLRGLADPSFGVSIEDMLKVCESMSWRLPSGKAGTYPKSIAQKLACPEAVVVVAYHMRELFHHMHPEFARTARWLEDTLAECLRSLDCERALDRCYAKPNAPDRKRIDLRYMADAFGPSTKSFGVWCNGWSQPTVVWRDVAVRECLLYGKVGFAITAMHARKGFRPLTKQILIENIMQSAARCAMVEGQLLLADEFPYQLTVHDEIMLIVPGTPEAVLAARDGLLRVFGPEGGLLLPRWEWSALANPHEINVSKSLYEVDVGKLLPEINGKPQPSSAWWAALAEGNQSLLENLP